MPGLRHLSSGLLGNCQGRATAPVREEIEQEENLQPGWSQHDWGEMFGVDHTQGGWAEVDQALVR